ncbi:phage baseplate assembly protein V [Jatrophihabitans telluris]|uniref:Phage baseplate assembly protein V n=1 Tax=Jatrophihabitans telluris TaxID=2038343 RepID=A0ABY4QSS6_9ACTN|nr:phage baseplate assembly protein V [Jatrophihabitans telluris]UQX86824.1 phage baseplate assembly protein V [Jatrophihabitans telluris]
MNPQFGKFRGTVVDNRDPLLIGRILVSCPAVLGEEPAWAEACLPFMAPNTGLLNLPPVGASVWIEFEAGDSRYPIWAGQRLDASSQWPEAQQISLTGPRGERIDIDERAQTISLTHPNGTSVVVSEAAVRITAPTSVEVTAPVVRVRTAELSVDGTLSAATVVASRGMVSPSYQQRANH